MRVGFSVLKSSLYLGCPLNLVVDELLACRENGEKTCIEFNGVWLYSDTVTMDSAYLEVTGKTREELETFKEKF